MDKEIEDWRKKIDELDEKLVKLFNLRAEFAIEIGKIKYLLNIPLHSPQRETQIYDHVQSMNAGPLSDAAIRRLFERLIDETRRLERETCEKGLGNGNQHEA
jgi:chorismate mutase